MTGDTWIVLLRGINVGRAKRVAMADLRALLADLGHQNVRTLRNSGNVVLEAPDATRGEMAARVEAALAERLGVASRAIVLAAAELKEVVRAYPWRELRPRTQVAFLSNPADRARLEPLVGHKWSPEALAVGARVAYLWCPNGQSRSALAKAVAEALGDRVTTRTWSTVEKLHALAHSRGTDGP